MIQDTINLLRKAKVNATWFVTHPTKMLKTLQTDFNHELGIHPNFNDLLNGISKNSSEKVLRDCLKVIPDAKSVRSHSLTQNERLVDQFKASGLTHISIVKSPEPGLRSEVLARLKYSLDDPSKSTDGAVAAVDAPPAKT